MINPNDNQIQYLTQAGVVFLTFFVVMFFFFYVTSPVVDAFFTSYNSLEVGDATDEVQTYGPVFHFVVKMILALGMAIPIVWFIFWTLSTDPSKYKRRLF